MESRFVPFNITLRRQFLQKCHCRFMAKVGNIHMEIGFGYLVSNASVHLNGIVAFVGSGSWQLSFIKPRQQLLPLCLLIFSVTFSSIQEMTYLVFAWHIRLDSMPILRTLSVDTLNQVSKAFRNHTFSRRYCSPTGNFVLVLFLPQTISTRRTPKL